MATPNERADQRLETAIPADAQLILASQSPRRRELLTQMGLRYGLMPADIDESVLANESAADYVARLALAKAQTAWAHYAQLGTGVDLPCLGADTSVVLGDQILGKPRDKADAVSMLCSLSEQTHQVYTGVACVQGSQQAVEVVCTDVSFSAITQQQALAYWQTGEPQDKAGAYGIQGLAAVFVRRISGSYSGVVGLPVHETAKLLAQFSVRTL